MGESEHLHDDELAVLVAANYEEPDMGAGFRDSLLQRTRKVIAARPGVLALRSAQRSARTMSAVAPADRRRISLAARRVVLAAVAALALAATALYMVGARNADKIPTWYDTATVEELRERSALQKWLAGLSAAEASVLEQTGKVTFGFHELKKTDPARAELVERLAAEARAMSDRAIRLPGDTGPFSLHMRRPGPVARVSFRTGTGRISPHDPPYTFVIDFSNGPMHCIPLMDPADWPAFREHLKAERGLQ